MDWILLALILAYAARVVFRGAKRCKKTSCSGCPGCTRNRDNR